MMCRTFARVLGFQSSFTHDQEGRSMLQSRIKRGVVYVVCSLAIPFLISYQKPASTQAVGQADEQEQQNTPAAEQMAEQKYKNIQVLKSLPAAQLRPMMNYFAATMGVTCAGCHVKTGDQWEFEKDDNNHKKIARKMILMTMELNKQHFNGKVQITCMTCHQGHDHPISIPPLPAVGPKEEPRPTPPFPTPKDILAKYAQAVGGREALEKVQTRLIKGSSVAANGQSFPLEISFAGPDKFVCIVALPQGATTQRLNGSAGWLKNAREDREMDSVEMARARSLAMSLDPMLLLRDPNLRLSFGGYDKVGDREGVTLRFGLAGKKRVRFLFAE